MVGHNGSPSSISFLPLLLHLVHSIALALQGCTDHSPPPEARRNELHTPPPLLLIDPQPAVATSPLPRPRRDSTLFFGSKATLLARHARQTSPSSKATPCHALFYPAPLVTFRRAPCARGLTDALTLHIKARAPSLLTPVAHSLPSHSSFISEPDLRLP